MQLRMAIFFQMHCIYSLHNLNVQLAFLDIMGIKLGNPDGEDRTIPTVGDCQDQMYHDLKYTLSRFLIPFYVMVDILKDFFTF